MLNIAGFYFTGFFSIIGASLYLIYFRRFIYSVKINKKWDKIIFGLFNHFGSFYEYRTIPEDLSNFEEKKIFFHSIDSHEKGILYINLDKNKYQQYPQI